MSGRKDGWAIYATHHDVEHVLLNDGCWTVPDNCRGAVAERDMRDFGVVRCRPLLFRTKAQAARHIRQCFGASDARIAGWTFSPNGEESLT